MLIGQTISHYRVVELLGAGGMGEMFKAEDTTLKRAVALKFLPLGLTQDPDAEGRLLHEAQAASALRRGEALRADRPDTDGHEPRARWPTWRRSR